MPGITSEQIQRAKETDVLGYLLSCEPWAIRKSGPHEYCLVEHDSLKISNGKWFWHSRCFGGYDALSFLIKVRGEGFVNAVEILTGSETVPARAPPYKQEVKSSPQKAFVLPEASRFPVKAISYLQDRGISPEVIGRCLSARILYESKRYHNCVFVGRDETGRVRFASQRGTDTDFKRDVAGSNKRYGFCYPAAEQGSRRLAVFESAIDCLSHASMQERESWNWDGHRLALGGTSPSALLHFLEQKPETSRVYLCLDNDGAGWTAASRIQEQLAADTRFSRIRVTLHLPPTGKDWNEHLLDQDIEKQKTERVLTR